MLRIRKLIITIRQEELLKKFAKSKTESKYLTQRAEIILAAKHCKLMKDVKITEAISRDAIKKWVTRWIEAEEQLAICEKEAPRKLEKLIRSLLADKQRSGRSTKFTAEQVIKIIAVPLESPESFGLEISNWTYPDLRRKVIELGIVENISESQVRRFLKRSRFKSK